MGSQKHVVVIGGTKGLGFEVAKAAMVRGDSVTVTGRDAQGARDTAAALGGAAGGACDLSDFDSVTRFFEGVDRVDHLVLSGLQRDHNTIADFRAGDSAHTMVLKTVGYAAAVAQAVPKFTEDASVVLFSGLSMLRPAPGSTTISMANAAIIGLMNTLVTEIAPVRVNTVTPSAIRGTDAVDSAAPVRAEYYESMRQRTAGQRLPTTEDVVQAVLFLQDCRGVNGLNLIVDGAKRLA